MDEEVAGWIIEFLARQRVDHKVVDNLLSTLPVPRHDSRLKKVLLLHCIQSEVSAQTVSDKILDLLVLVRTLDFNEGKFVLESMKMAFCAVVVDCTRRFLDNNSENDMSSSRLVKRTWRDRVRKMEKSEAVGLISNKLLQWMDLLEDGSHNREVCATILSGDTRNDALKAVEGYLHDAWNDMGPSFIYSAAEDVVKNKMGRIERGKDDHRDEEAPRVDGCGERPGWEHHIHMSRDESGDPAEVEDLDNAAAAEHTNVVGDEQAMDGGHGRFNVVMERKPGAHAYEWEELGEDSAGVAPSRPDGSGGPEKKRKRWWTNVEEDTLRRGVREFGIGSWAAILAKYRDQFQGRTAVNLKDKWRTITK